jgi:hypothetical protein
MTTMTIPVDDRPVIGGDRPAIGPGTNQQPIASRSPRRS